ncbi:hypothetical protein CH373_01315 [Leptospira perolatii]|uniref:Uncharacterized protein n=1 Tax=Leptospira perolatii TaxID=2023191 RepID=A0A2M9ZRK6_9LEPT|nr:hypothetical protein [Leptospira perolatii]PJZ71184.1 hypothetical protein CH360_01315 [Leptospira perolatii]PJZ74717.1 hypothetical protein CH373_01315 [Leptospira perolatii]
MKFLPLFIGIIQILFFLIWTLDCSLLPELPTWLGGRETLVQNQPATKVYWNLTKIPATSEAFVQQPGVLHYFILKNPSSSEKSWKAEVNLWETKEEFVRSLPKNVHFPKLTLRAAVSSGISKISEGEPSDPKRILYFPKTDVIWEYEGNTFSSQAKGLQFRSAKRELKNWVLEFEIGKDNAWLSMESRNMDTDVWLTWRNLKSWGFSSVPSTDYINPDGKITPYIEYDYSNINYKALPILNEALPVWIFWKENGVSWAWAFLPEEMLSPRLLAKQKKGEGAPLLFYDPLANNPFTARANLENYPIIYFTDENYVRN